MVITNPPQFAGLTMSEYASNHVDWSISKRERLQRHHIFDPQVVMCPSSLPVETSSPGGNDEHMSILPIGVERYRRTPQCRRTPA